MAIRHHETYAKGILTSHVPVATTAAIVTIAAVAGKQNVLNWIAYSYDTKTGAIETLTIETGTSGSLTTVLTVYIENANYLTPQMIHFGDHPIVSGANEQIVVTLSAPTAGSGTVTTHHY